MNIAAVSQIIACQQLYVMQPFSTPISEFSEPFLYLNRRINDTIIESHSRMECIID